MRKNDHIAALVRLFAYKIAGSVEKAEELVSWAYGIQGLTSQISPGDQTEIFINNYLSVGKRPRNVVVRDFAEKYVATLVDNLDYERIRATIKNMEYKDFLKTIYWRGVALIVKERAGNKCEICGSKKYLVAHHTSYNHHGDELHHLEDLRCICQGCHKKEHGIEPEK